MEGLWSDGVRTKTPPCEWRTPWFDAIDALVGDEWQSIRDTFDRWLESIPAEKRADLIQRLRVGDDEQAHGAVAEMFTAHWLKTLGYEVNAGTLGNQTPDFECSDARGKFIVEVTTLNTASRTLAETARANEVIDRINRAAASRTDLPPYMLHVTFWSVGTRSLRYKSLIPRIHHWLKDLTSEGVPTAGVGETLWWMMRDSNGWESGISRWSAGYSNDYTWVRELEFQGWSWIISLSGIPLADVRDESAFGRVGISGPGRGYEVPQPNFAAAVKSKTRAYGRLASEQGLPLVVVVGHSDTFGRAKSIDALDAVFNGTTTEHVDANWITTGYSRNPDGLWAMRDRLDGLTGVILLETAGWKTAHVRIAGASWCPQQRPPRAVARVLNAAPSVDSWRSGNAHA